VSATARPAAPPRFDVERVRADFPLLATRRDGRPLVYLDNAATSQKPRSVLEASDRYYREQNANIHRAVYRLSEEATAAYEGVRVKAARWLGAPESREIVFVRGTTEAINLVAATYGRLHVGAGDEILLSAMEHHSNIVPWQMLAEEKGARVRVIPMDQQGQLRLDEARALIGPRTKLLALAHVSNSLGTVNPVRELVAMAREHGVPVLLDGAQAAPHQPIDVQALGCDFYAVSGHKMFGPTGVGLLWARGALLDAMPPYQGGGDMIRSVTFEKTTYAPVPAKFEAGTPNIAGVIGLGAAIDYIEGLPWDAVRAHEAALLARAVEQLCDVPGVRLVGTAEHKAPVVSFVLDGVHAHDVGTVVDQQGVCVRTGHHCTQPVMDFFGVPATTRASMACYNTIADVDALAAAVRHVRELFA
jgi:cysteine desulfurase / selenocysteine lyase